MRLDGFVMYPTNHLSGKSLNENYLLVFYPKFSTHINY